MNLLIAVALASIFTAISYRLQWLTPGGAVCAGLFGFCLMWMGGLPWIVPVIAFFATSTGLSRLGESTKKESERNVIQVLANGGVAWLFLLLYTVYPAGILYAGFAGSLAAATSDTWATEIGRLYGKKTCSILTGKSISKGDSGGVSFEGTLGSVAGAVLIGLAAGLFSGITFGMAAVPAGLLGSLADSVLGATVQARYRDEKTGAISEQRIGPAIRGWSWMNNDAVNGMCTAIGGVLACLFYLWVMR